ncbi:MAG: hypothetical protein KY466_09435 [Gemmatimonadetes bacterium]|nr:hypothetical protein [Gemmatimonadota bacterium]
MRTSFRLTARVRGCLIAVIGLAGVLAGGTGLTAQQLTPGRFESAALPASVLDSGAPALAPERAPLARVALGTAMGGVLGGVIGAAAGAAFGGLEGESGGFISASEALGAIGLAVGYPVGAAIGARIGATVDGARPSLGSLVLASSFSAVAGGLVWNRVGEGFESAHSMSSWYMGAVAGVGTHWLITSLAAQRAPTVPAGPVDAPGDPGV